MNAISTLLAASLIGTAAAFAGDPLNLDMERGSDNWRIVVDGVMGGRSTGRVSSPSTGILRFAGNLSLANNGGFSQMRTNVSGDAFDGADGVEIRVKGDGRTYQFDIRCSNVRLMAGGFQQNFETTAGEWKTIRLSFDDFRLYSFGRLVSNAPDLEPLKIESVGVTLGDKKEGAFALEVDWIRTFGSDATFASNDTTKTGDDLVSVAKSAGLNTLIDLVVAADLELPADGDVTIFAPTDDAFAALPESTVEYLLTAEGKDTLRSILTYHVASGSVTSSDLFGRRTIDSLNGQRVDIESNGSLQIDDANLIVVDVPFDGGVVHVVDAVLMPELDSIVDLAVATESLSTLATAVSVAGLGDQLGSENGPWTVFAPIDSAFAALPDGTLDSLLKTENRAQLIDILGYHIVPGRIYANELLATERTQTFFGKPIEFSIANGRLNVNDISIVGSDIEAANGVIHLIDSVLLPSPEQSDSTSAWSATTSAEGMRLMELAINRGAPLFNKGQITACASVYEVTIESMVGLGSNDLGQQVLERLERGLSDASQQSSARERAWIYRSAMDEAYEMLARQAESADTATASK